VLDDLVYTTHQDYFLRSERHRGDSIARTIDVVKFAVFGHSITAAKEGIGKQYLPTHLCKFFRRKLLHGGIQELDGVLLGLLEKTDLAEGHRPANPNRYPVRDHLKDYS
ncbi:MAG: hypothetical protein L7F78_25065, partial [Syntrophales bacterium LBB04]|nr:hypothetical protein [Syntrophales bacterium LBB04]